MTYAELVQRFYRESDAELAAMKSARENKCDVDGPEWDEILVLGEVTQRTAEEIEKAKIVTKDDAIAALKFIVAERETSSPSWCRTACCADSSCLQTEPRSSR